MPQYPKEILPQENYLIQLHFDEMLDEIPLTAVRRSGKKIDYSANSDLPENCITGQDVAGMSMNLLGGGYKAEEHLKFRTRGRGSDAWDGGTITEVSDGDYEIVEVGSPIFFSFKRLHHVRIPYERQFGSENEFYSYYNNMNQSDASSSDIVWKRDGPNEVWGEIFVEHKPTMMNYWHVELLISDRISEANLIERTRSGWNKCLRRKVVAYLRSHYLLPDKVEQYTIPESMYKNKA